MKRILFQGDSITDAGRNMNSGSKASIGQGYAMLVSAAVGRNFPEAYEFLNTGISGNRIVDIYQRIKCDFWNLKPDIYSMLIGVNDVLHEASYQNGVEADRFRNVYRMLLADTKQVLPNLKIILMEPFVLKGEATEQNWGFIRDEVAKRREIVREMAEEFQTGFVPLQQIFDTAINNTNSAYWVADGVHPTPAGHQLIAEEWLKVFCQTEGINKW